MQVNNFNATANVVHAPAAAQVPVHGFDATRLRIQGELLDIGKGLDKALAEFNQACRRSGRDPNADDYLNLLVTWHSSFLTALRHPDPQKVIDEYAEMLREILRGPGIDDEPYPVKVYSTVPLSIVQLLVDKLRDRGSLLYSEKFDDAASRLMDEVRGDGFDGSDESLLADPESDEEEDFAAERLREQLRGLEDNGQGRQYADAHNQLYNRMDQFADDDNDDDVDEDVLEQQLREQLLRLERGDGERVPLRVPEQAEPEGVEGAAEAAERFRILRGRVNQRRAANEEAVIRVAQEYQVRAQEIRGGIERVRRFTRQEAAAIQEQAEQLRNDAVALRAEAARLREQVDDVNLRVTVLERANIQLQADAAQLKAEIADRKSNWLLQVVMIVVSVVVSNYLKFPVVLYIDK